MDNYAYMREFPGGPMIKAAFSAFSLLWAQI